MDHATSQAEYTLRQKQRRHVQHQTTSATSSVKCRVIPLTVSEDALLQHASQIVIAHRGASAHLPEHTLEAYRLALELGADYIEPDLVATKDGQLIAIHTMDLSITTNVEDVFSYREKTPSPYKNNEKGYWTYDFTLQELKQLTVRQRLPQSRSTLFDGLFGIPTLTDILNLLVDWNENVQPQLYNLNGTTTNPSTPNLSYNRLEYPPPPRGMYAELKDSPWLFQDTNVKLLDLFIQHMEEYADLWQRAMWQYMCDTKLLKEHQYKLPVLIMQAFQADVLQDFTKTWHQLSNSNDKKNEKSFSLTAAVPDPENPSSSLELPLPVPPTILLVSEEVCHQEEFWFEIEDKFREDIRGVGVDKRCFFGSIEEDGHVALQYLPTIMEKARKADWVVHPWTERPESEFLVQDDLNRRRGRNIVQRNEDENDNSSSVLPPPILPSSHALSSPFSTVMEELMFFKCKVGVHGIFSESVDTAVRAFNMACPKIDCKEQQKNNNENTGGGGSGSSSVPAAACPSPSTATVVTNDIPLVPLVLFTFFLGVLVTLVVLNICRSIHRRRRPWADGTATHQNGANDHHHHDGAGIVMTRIQKRRGQHGALPTSEEDAHQDHDLTLAVEHHEIL